MSSFRKSIVSYSSAMMFCRFVAIVQGLVILRWMTPTELGPWFALQLISLYGAHAHLGILNAVNRQIPFHHGRKEEEKAERIEAVARGAILLFIVAGLVVVGVMALLGVGTEKYGNGIVLMTLTATLALGVHYYLGLFRARNQFGRAGWGNVVNALVILGGLPLVYFFKYDGLLWRIVAATSLSLLVCIALDRFNFKIAFSWSETLALVRIGVPIMIVVLALTAFASMDRTLILKRLDEQAMGLYALAFSVARVMALVPNTIGQLFYPRMTALYASEGLSRGLVRRCLQASGMSGLTSASVGIAAVLLLPWIVEQFFPRFIDGLPPLRIAMIGYVTLSLAAGPTYFLIATAQKRRQLVALLCGAGTMVFTAYFIAPQTLEGIAISFVAGTFLYIGGLWSIVIASTRRARERAA